MANTCLTSPPCMKAQLWQIICLPSPTISISTFSHIMQARRHPNRAIQRLQGEKRYRPLVGSFQGVVLQVTKITMFVQLWKKDTQQKIGTQKMQTVVSTLSCGKLLGELHLQIVKPFLWEHPSPDPIICIPETPRSSTNFPSQSVLCSSCWSLHPKKRTDQCFG